MDERRPDFYKMFVTAYNSWGPMEYELFWRSIPATLDTDAIAYTKKEAESEAARFEKQGRIVTASVWREKKPAKFLWRTWRRWEKIEEFTIQGSPPSDTGTRSFDPGSWYQPVP